MLEFRIKLFENKTMKDLYYVKSGLSTGDNDLFLRHWYEIGKNSFSAFNDYNNTNQFKWVPYNKGGGVRKWYGINTLVVNWGNDGETIKKYGRGVFRNPQLYLKEGITWSGIASSGGTFRYCRDGFIFDSNKGPMIFNKAMDLNYALGLLNTKVVQYILPMLNPTVSLQIGDIESVPMIVSEEKKEEIIQLVDDNVRIAKEEWDSFETSWDFETHPFVKIDRSYQEGAYAVTNVAHYYNEGLEASCPVEACYMLWEKECNSRFETLRENEEELNRIFIEVYNLQDELTPKLDDKKITIRKADLSREIRSLLSYAVGCMFGRYSLDEPGLVFAGENFDKKRYKSFIADEDAIIPITDEQYFDDDIVGRFEEFLRCLFGEDTLEANLQYIADVLGTKGNSSREKIRNYFLNDFFKDHCNMYSVNGSGKRPIYWLFDSGKHNGFKCLIYLHRYTPDTVGLIRSDYLTKAQNMIENALKNAEYAINTSGSAVDRAQATKKRDKYIKQLAEIRAYYPALSHIALQRIKLNLDDGVKVNYEKFQNIEVSIEGEKKQKVDLLAKI